MKRFTSLLLAFVLASTAVGANTLVKIPTPENLKQGHPRLYITQEEKGNLEQTIENEEWAQEVLSGIEKRIDTYVDRHVEDPEWMPSRLLMHWKTKSTDIYIKGITYSHAGGEAAPVATVRFEGSRDGTTNYMAPSIENIMPYMDDPRGLYLQNKTIEGRPFEWVDQSKTGGIVKSVNNRIINLARDAAFVYWLEGDVKYAKFAYDVFNTYMQGMYYRSEPIDLDHGHIQTLVGLTGFQTIHESTLKSVAELYDFLHQYIEANHKDQMANYETTIKKWTDLIIKNGVPQNNWNLHQANIIIKAAMVLDDNENYEDGKGREYYIDYLLNTTSTRQWSLTKLLDFGYDPNNGVWAECPGYSQGVTKDVMAFISDYYTAFDSNILPYLPVMQDAVTMLPQYLFPNNQTIAFGDSNYSSLGLGAMDYMIRIAQKSGDKKLEEKYTALYRTFAPKSSGVQKVSKPRAEVASFFASKPLELNDKYEAGNRSDYITQTFYAPNVSWHTQRMGEGKDGMMVSLNASLGNHMHANGINMELYGKGLVQGADPGKGANYLQAIYLEYYSQFPAHNTVMVDGVSSYTEMFSNHGFSLKGEYPTSEARSGYYPNITYSNVYFLEPETQSDQQRTVSIVKTAPSTGYYVDIFRSKRKDNKDKFHDYYYHNLGQSMKVMDGAGKELPMVEEDRVSFAGGYLYALDYMWGEKYIETNKDYQVEWKIDYKGAQEDVFMNLWMKGTEDREIISILSPSCKSFHGHHNLPYDLENDPYLTFIARQRGEAWDKPFISVYEPYTSTEGKSIASITSFEDEKGGKSFAGLKIESKSGRVDYIFSSENGCATYKGMSSDAEYALVGEISKDSFELFLGNGKVLNAKGVKISTKEPTNVVLKMENGKYMLHNLAEVTITVKGKSKKFAAGDMRSIKL